MNPPDVPKLIQWVEKLKDEHKKVGNYLSPVSLINIKLERVGHYTLEGVIFTIKVSSVNFSHQVVQ